MSTLERAIEIAAEAHVDQRDKGGSPYIAHPLRVALPFIRAGDELRAIVAVLHDVIEDSPMTTANLDREGFSAEVVGAIIALTRRKDEPYLEFVKRAASNPVARPVKLADLRDNLSETRMAKLEPAKRERLLDKYQGALELLEP
jgi:(p)ppGpp synthase/HD superfamily hydrolase